MPPKPASWQPQHDEKILSPQEFLEMAERKYPGISRHPQFRQAFDANVQKALSLLPPVRARANARLRGYAEPLTDAQHTQAIKAHTGVRTYHRKNGIRRNYGPGADRDNLRALFGLLANLYITQDKPVTALRELIQNSADAINDPKTGSKALGQVGQTDGRIDVTFDRRARTLTVEDNGSGMTPEILCKFTTLAGTTKGKTAGWGKAADVDEDYPPFSLRVRVFPRPGDGSSPPDGGRYWIRINGLYQFDLDKTSPNNLLPADYVFEYRGTGSTGGFGAAKAVIFLSSQDLPPRWDVYTQDNYYDGEMADRDIDEQNCSRTKRANVRKMPYRQGTKITIYNLDEGLFDGVRGASKAGVSVPGSNDPIEYRMQRILMANSLNGITITFNGKVIEPLFPAQGGGQVQFGDSGGRNWFDGVFKHPDQRKNPESWIERDLVGTTSNPQSDNYQFTKGRDAFSGNSRWAFQRFTQAVEFTLDDLKKKTQDRPNIVFDPGDPDSGNARQNEEIDRLMAENLQASAGLQDYLREATETALAFQSSVGRESRLREQVIARKKEKKQEEIQRMRERGDESKAREKEKELKEEIRQAQEEAPRSIEQGVVSAAEAAEQLKALEKSPAEVRREQYQQIVQDLYDRLVRQDRERQNRGLPGFDRLAYDADFFINLYDFRTLLLDLYAYSRSDWQVRGYLRDTLRWQVVLSDAATDGDGLTEIAAINKMFSEIFKFCGIREATLREVKQEVGVTNPFGKSVALLVETDKFTRLKSVEQRDWKGKIIKDEQGRPVMELEPVFDEARYNRFLKNYAKYVPMLLMWDQAVRQIIAVTNSRPDRGFRFYTGFVLNDEAHAVWALSPSTNNLILVNPLLTTAVAKTFQTAGDFAAFIHAKACHEIAHMVRGTDHKDSHDEQFSIARESIGFRSVAIIPLIAKLAQDWTGLPNPYVKEPVAALKERYRKIAEDITCGTCMKQVVESLETTGRLDTVRWIQDRIGWERADDPQLPAELRDGSEDDD